MKKIMFNDEYCLTQAVLEGIKTQTRRVIPCSVIAKAEDRRLTYYDRTFDVVSLEQMLLDDGHLSDGKPLFSYRVGEKIAIAQSYRDIQRECMYKDLPNRCFLGGPNSNTSKAGWTNKMFVKPELMLHHIVITGIRVEKLHDISDSDCISEGIQKGEFMNTRKEYYFSRGENPIPFYTPREAYSSLIDRVSGKGSWDCNPYVFVYDFKLID